VYVVTIPKTMYERNEQRHALLVRGGFNLRLSASSSPRTRAVAVVRGGVETYSTISPSDARRRVLLDSVRQGGRAAFRQRLREELASTPTLSPTAEHLGAAPSAAE